MSCFVPVASSGFGSLGFSLFAPRIFTTSPAMSVTGFAVFPNFERSADVTGLSVLRTESLSLKKSFCLVSTAAE